jgi:quinoprotein glucose dehydrogenase
VRAEAARAIDDVPIDDVLGDLAATIARPDLLAMDVRVPVNADPNAFRASNGLVRRVLNANFRLGGTDHAAALAKFAANRGASPAARREALDLLAQWAEPPGRDPFCDEWMPLAPRDNAPVTAAVVELERTLHDDAPANVLRGWMRLAVQECVDSSASRLLSIAHDRDLDGGLRALALQSLGEIQPYGSQVMFVSALHDDDPRVRAASFGALLSVDPKGAMPLLEQALNATVPERRAAYQGMSRVARPEIDAILARDLAALDAGQLPPAIALDLVVAAEKRDAENVKSLLARRNDARKVDEKTAQYADSLYGGDADKGREIFRGKSALECLRCHTAEDDGGVVGPNLRDVSKRLTREAILESIVDPNRRFSPGYQGTIVFPLDGPPVEGSVIEDTAEHLVLRKADGTTAEVQKSEIDAVKPGLSAMPTNLAEHLSREEMRDLIEYLCTL